VRRRRIAIALIVAAAGSVLWLGRRERKPELDSPAILQQVQRLSQLSTVRYTVQKVVGLKEPKQPFGSESILLIMQASVEAGVDLGALRPDDVSTGPDGSLVLRLPAAKVLNVSVDEKETKVWDRRKTWWTPWIPYSIDLEQRARLAGIDAVRQTALDAGILKQAERNADAAIRSLLELAGVKNVVIVPASVS
jgi:hypothetical protein